MNIKTLCLTGALLLTDRYQYLRPKKERSNK